MPNVVTGRDCAYDLRLSSGGATETTSWCQPELTSHTPSVTIIRSVFQCHSNLTLSVITVSFLVVFRSYLRVVCRQLDGESESPQQTGLCGGYSQCRSALPCAQNFGGSLGSAL